ncbi:hypothetical protein C9374_011340 [Naegleria lovaniensis]|uniref:Ubiquitin fusion degradation protein n=1 Tax=Naegleria lovaniensis TaxID=51637 RepID=A0AA88GX68_NAELO|nr:uncharacterized protein C9374_011340 [Naegleria lovaniensis]KAG2392615.1 hypothetical protein C9374_011340 [Naegleria lovaniensis]
MNNYFQGVRIDIFKRPYRVYTGAFCGKPQLDEGGKIMLPASALDELARLNIVYPMLFKISNPKKKKYTHCGVLEFSAEEGRAYIPFWMQEYLQLAPGSLVNIESATLPKGTFVKIRPQQKAFIEISDPKAVLEKQLRNFSCLSRGDTIIIAYNNKQFFIDIVAVASASGDCEAVSIVETDVKVEFERPADMPPSPINPQTPSADELFKVKPPSQQPPTAQPTKEEPKEVPKFTGVGRRLDGKGASSSSQSSSSSTQTSTTSSSTTTTTKPAAVSSSSPSTTPPSNGTSLNTSGLVVGRKRKTYGEEDKNKQAGTSASSNPTTEKKDENKFKAFSGQGRSLK